MANQIITNLITKRGSINDTFLPEYTPAEMKSFNEHMMKTYIGPGKILSRTQHLSEDLLTRTIVTVWVNDEERLKYLQDPIVAKRLAEIAEYFKKNDNFEIVCMNQEVSNGEVIREWQIDY